MSSMVESAYGTFEYAGEIAGAWFRAMSWKNLTTAEQREQEDEILDIALHDAGVTPLDRKLEDLKLKV